MSLIDEALSRLPSQWQGAPNFSNLIRSLLVAKVDSQDVLAYLLTQRWIGNAVGVWLDEVGEIVGMPRQYVAAVDGVFTYKATGELDNPALGYSTQSEPRAGGRYASAAGFYSDVLWDDDTYRNWIKGKVEITDCEGTYNDVYNFIKTVFGIESTVVKGGVREVDVTIASAIEQGDRVRLLRWAPISAGINLQIVNWP